VEVHRPKLAIAVKSEHPRDVPGNAFPLAGAQVGNRQTRSLFVWFSCSTDAGMPTIDCMKCTPTVSRREWSATAPEQQTGRLFPKTSRLIILRAEKGGSCLRLAQFSYLITEGESTTSWPTPQKPVTSPPTTGKPARRRSPSQCVPRRGLPPFRLSPLGALFLRFAPRMTGIIPVY
jgi:hypothetical protein